MKNKKLILGIIVFCSVAAVIFAYSYQRSYLVSWDALPYVATLKVLEDDSKDFAAIHRETYAMLESKFAGKGYESVCLGDEYKDQCWSSAEAFRQQLRFYSVKPAYNYFNLLLVHCGLNEIDALYANSFIFSLLIYGLIFFFLRLQLDVANSLLLTPIVFVLGSGAMLINTASTPDVMLGFFSLLALYAIVRGKYSIGMLLLLATVPIRSDSMLRYFVVMAIVAAYAPAERKRMAVAAVVGLVCYFAFTKIFPSYSWSVLFYHSHLGRLTFPAEAQVSISIWDYLYRLVVSSRYIVDVFMFLIFVPAYFLLHGKRLPIVRSDISLLLVFGSVVFFVAHYLLHPEVSIRYFYVDGLFVMIISAIALAKRTNAKPLATE